MKDKEPLRGVGIGAGYFSHYQYEAWNRIPEVQITGIYNRTHAKAEAIREQYKIGRVYDTVEEMLAHVEAAMISGEDYRVPKGNKSNAGIIVTLSKVKHPDYSQFDDPSIWWNLHKDYHIGFIFKDDSTDIVKEKLDFFAGFIADNYAASVPLKE